MFPLFPWKIWKTKETGHLEKFSFPVAKHISPLNQFSFTIYAKCRQIFSFRTKKRYFVSFLLFYHSFFLPFWPLISGCRDICLPNSLSVSTSLQKIHKSILPSFHYANTPPFIRPSFPLCPSLQASQYVHSYFFPMAGPFSFSMYVRLFIYLPSAVSFPLKVQLSLSMH